jgi:hypothetical protein
MQANKARAKMSRKAERQQKANGLSQELQKINHEDELKDIFETQQKTDAANKILDMIKLKQFEHGRHALQRVVRQKIQRENAATKIKSVFKGHQTRQKVQRQAADIMEQKDMEQILNKVNKVEERANQIDKSALVIQKRFRQNKRKSTPITISNEPPISTIKPANLIADNVSRNIVKNSLNKIVRNQNAVKIQSAIRKQTAKRTMMKQRQLVGEEQLRQMEAAKRQAINDDAAKKLQASIKRVTPQNNLNQIKQAKEKIGAVSKRLMTERVDSTYSPTINKTAIWNKPTVGQPLVVNKQLKIVSKKKHDAAVTGYENRAAFLEMAKQYKPIMTKGQKKK